MGRGKPRVPHAAVEARREVLDALQAGEALPEPEARALVEKLERAYRQSGWSDGYDEGHHDGTWQE
jgi:hypothetical protein